MVADKKPPLQPSTKSNIPGKTIEETYQKKTQLEHILLRPDTYVGSVEKLSQTLWVYEDNEMVHRSITYVPGLYKIFDEILVNAADNKQRDKSMDMLKVEINPAENFISVYNNGDGVPIEIHQEEGVYVPELIFGHLLTSSNYDDSERKTTGGRNGYGAKLTNIFSTEFTIETADGKRSKKYKQVFSNNMSTKTEPAITKCKQNENWTKVTFKPDLEKFNMAHLEEDVVALMKKRVIDIAGCLGNTVKVELNGTRVPVKSFTDYCNLYLKSVDKDREEPLPRFTQKVNDRWEVCITLSDGQFQQVSFVNSIATIKGGTHVDYVTNQITAHVINIVHKKGKNYGGVKAHAVKCHLWVFVNALIDNPAFDSQTKETLTTRANSFGSKCELSEEFLKKVAKSEIVDSVVQWAEYKQNKDLSKTDGVKRTRLSNITKLDDANYAGSSKSKNCTLILTEGDSAKSLAVSGLSSVGRDYYGVFPLRGKLLNVREATHKQIMENAEIQNIKQILGLQHGKEYKDVNSLRYGHLMIMTDQDHDGSHIKGLLINFIHSFWPSLLRIDSFLVEFITPIIKATKSVIINGKSATEKLAFYTIPQYESWRESMGGKKNGYTIKYYKGLGTSTAKEGREYFDDLAKHKKDFKWENERDGEAIEMAFSKKKIEARKNWIRQFEPGTHLDQTGQLVTYRDFVNKELILFSIADLQRSIPSMVDGLKPGQRKILYCCFKRNLVTDVKVTQFSGYVSEHSSYHHGEQSLASTIIGMAQHFVGTNNINLLYPSGTFGSRLKGGKDAASGRYILTRLCKITRLLFPKDDDGLLEYLNDDGEPIEPFWYIPIIPMVLVNGSEGIGTGWSSYIPNYNPRDIVANVRRLLNGEAMETMDPWYRGFKGRIEKTATKEAGATYTISGVIQEVDDTTLKILELPIRRWNDDYKEFLASCLFGSDKAKDPFIKDYFDQSTDVDVEFEVFMPSKEVLDMVKQEDLLKKFKLTTSISTSNMHLFDAKGTIKKYDTPEQLLEEFFPLRLEYYDKRQKLVLKNLELEQVKVDNKVRFILGVVKGEIIVNNRKRMDLFLELQQKGFTPVPKQTRNDNVALAGETEDVDKDVSSTEVDEDRESTEVVSSNGGPRASDYEYLVSLAIGTLTLEKVQELCAYKDKLHNDIEELKKMTPKIQWLKDLDALEKALDELDKLDAEEAAEAKEARDKKLALEAPNAKKVSKKEGAQNPRKKVNNNTSAAETVANSANFTAETVNVVGAVKPKGKAAPKKAPAKKGKMVLVDSEEERDDDNGEVHELKERLAAYNLNSSPEQSAAMETDEVNIPVNDESDEEFFVAGPKGGAKKGGRKPAAAAAKAVTKKPAAVKTAKAAAGGPTRKRGPAVNKQQPAPPLSQKLITDVLKPAETSSGASPDKKVRKIRASPFNKKSSSLLGRVVEEESGGGGSSSSASGSPDGEVEVVAARQRPQRANRGAAKYVLSDSEPDTDDSEFDVVEIDEDDD